MHVMMIGDSLGRGRRSLRRRRLDKYSLRRIAEGISSFAAPSHVVKQAVDVLNHHALTTQRRLIAVLSQQCQNSSPLITTITAEGELSLSFSTTIVYSSGPAGMS